MKHSEFTDSLRKIANFYDEHPEVPLPHTNRLVITPDAEDFPGIARAFGECEKVFDGPNEYDFFRLVKKFGAISLHAIEYRKNVCEKTVVGTHEVYHKAVPAYTEIVEEVEWKCDPILGGEKLNAGINQS